VHSAVQVELARDLQHFMAKLFDQTLPVLAYKKAVVPSLEDAVMAIVGRAQLLAWRKGMPSKSA
jgi:hypothetical protein